MNYREALKTGKETLLSNKIEDAEFDAWYLLEEVIGFSREKFLLEDYKLMPEEQYLRYRNLLKKRSMHIPLQHLIGYQDFMGFRFIVNTDVLIPRQETELLVEMAGAVCKGSRVLDVCTGSGCIIISLAKLYKIKQAVAVDLSEKALHVAKRNNEALGTNVTFLQSDLFHEVKGTYDVIISNPPYIKTKELDFLMPEVRDFEPRMALDGKEDGLYFYRRIADESRKFLVSSGYLFLEIGHNQADEIKDILSLYGFYNIVIKKDYAGLDRIIISQYNQ